jgi:hypothetical protein
MAGAAGVQRSSLTIHVAAVGSPCGLESTPDKSDKKRRSIALHQATRASRPCADASALARNLPPLLGAPGHRRGPRDRLDCGMRAGMARIRR